MTEILARVSATNGIELVTDKMAKIPSLASLTPQDAAYLARGILAGAAALSAPNPPKEGVIMGDAHLPIIKWVVGRSKINGEPVLLLTIPSGIELTFQMPAQGAVTIGAALVAEGKGTAPAGGHSGTVH